MHLVYLQTSYMTTLPLYPLFLCTTTNHRTDLSTTRKILTSKKAIPLTICYYLWSPYTYTFLIVHVHTSMMEIGKKIVGNPWRVIIHDIVLKCKVKSWATHISVAKTTKILKTYHIVKINFLPFSELAQMACINRVFRREIGWKIYFSF